MMQTIYLMVSLASTISAESIRQYNNREKLIRKIGLSFLNFRPNITVEGIFYKNQYLPSGTIVKRPLKVEKLTELTDEYHYAIVLGTDASGNWQFIEMTDVFNVRIVGLEDFLFGYELERMGIYKTPKMKIDIDTIYLRASEYEFSPYSILNLNCKDFAENVVFQKKPIRRGDELNKHINKLTKNVIDYLKASIKSTNDIDLKAMYQSEIRRLENENDIREKSLLSS